MPTPSRPGPDPQTKGRFLSVRHTDSEHRSPEAAHTERPRAALAALPGPQPADPLRRGQRAAAGLVFPLHSKGECSAARAAPRRGPGPAPEPRLNDRSSASPGAHALDAGRRVGVGGGLRGWDAGGVQVRGPGGAVVDAVV